MKFNDILMAIDNNTMIRVTMEMCGMKFSTNHYAEYFLDCDKAGELLDKRVIDMGVVENNVLEIVLENK